MEDRDQAVEYALKEARDGDVKFIRLWFTDILGNLKGFAITYEELEAALTRGMGFDGSAIEGFARAEEKDLYALPDPNTFSLLPWRPRSNAVARMFCDIVTPDDAAFEGDPRWVLRRNIERAAHMGFTYYVGPELEYFYFKDSTSAVPLDQGGYFDQDATSQSTDLRRETVLMLEELGIPVEQSHHEVAPSQHEIDLRHTDAMTMADTVMTYRVVVKEIAQRHDCYASFMPKPIASVNGNGMHTHQSLFKGGRNAFFDGEDPERLSDVARHFIAGLLAHAREITAITNQWVNSYKRLVPNYEAPTFVSWATVNRSDLVRVPSFKPGREESRRIEYRAPDPAANPYLAFSVMLAAGLDGIEKKLELPPPSASNVFDMPASEREERRIQSLPGNLWEAISVTEDSELVRNALGDLVFDSFIENKKIEWERYRSHVTDYEITRYLPTL
ncbi:MAG TPA: glutamine synthetase [Dehalococcoidia bacterium]|jgi:glutamine synthetase|nr:glutamine synthetase family protein [SAR202 cluster bacterium]MDP6663847.1 glutamine synthetase family protein [SAR202 cluster bacterium]MDP6801054.1 glutamine synthetase family protein [SAR202 cluster bacterium]HAL47632.1 glutamine synthetase [Dehalococcoidia bacterium]|tara:strand:+ start:571 stop:1905 length:1335 start_codon:yes stop_codon:yes gene_type:complete